MCIQQIYAQNPLDIDVRKMQENARKSLDNGDIANSIALLNQAIHLAPNDVSLRRDLAYSYYISNKFETAKDIITPILKSDFADEQTFQLAAGIEGGLNKYKNARKILQKGIQKYPNSGLLYHNQGNLMLREKKEKQAVQSWKKGVEVEPSFPLNYYQLAKYFNQESNSLWALLYAEIYLNLDPYSQRTAEMKKLLLENYQLLIRPSIATLPAFKEKNKKHVKETPFESTFKNALLEHAAVTMNGINIESITMLRTRFLISWQSHQQEYPFTLFNFQNNLLQNGYFEAYNQWLFGSFIDSQDFGAWIRKHQQLYTEFENWFKNNPLQPATFDPQPSY